MTKPSAFKWKHYQPEIIMLEARSFVTVEEEFKKVDNWWNHFHPNGLYC